MNETQLLALVRDLVGDHEVYGIQANDDFSQIQVRVFVNGLPFLQVFERDKQTGKYEFVSEHVLGQMKF